MATAPYVINPDDPTNPTENLTMGAAAAELRGLKQRVLLAREETADLETRALTHEGANPYELDAQLNANGNKITELPTATEASDATPLSQVVALIQERLGFLSQITWAPGLAIEATPTRQWTVVAGQAYVATSNHIASAAFADDLAAGRWLALDVAQVLADLASTASGKGAEMVAFKQSGAGAVDRTAQDKLREVVSVKDFGAVGDGVTDDSAAITAAQNAATAAGAVLYFPAGTYKCSAVTLRDIRVDGEILSTGTTTATSVVLAGSIDAPDNRQIFAHSVAAPTNLPGTTVPFRFDPTSAPGLRVSVRWFGAKGDNTTDDTAALNFCATAMTFSISGGTPYSPLLGPVEMFFPRGNYRIGGTVCVCNGTLMRGESSGSNPLSTLIRDEVAIGSASAADMIWMVKDNQTYTQNPTQAFFENLSFVWRPTSGFSSSTLQLKTAFISFKAAAISVKMRGCWFLGSPQKGSVFSWGNNYEKAAGGVGITKVDTGTDADGIQIDLSCFDTWFDVIYGTLATVTDKGYGFLQFYNAYVWQLWMGFVLNLSTNSTKRVLFSMDGGTLYGVCIQIAPTYPVASTGVNSTTVWKEYRNLDIYLNNMQIFNRNMSGQSFCFTNFLVNSNMRMTGCYVDSTDNTALFATQMFKLDWRANSLTLIGNEFYGSMTPNPSTITAPWPKAMISKLNGSASDNGVTSTLYIDSNKIDVGTMNYFLFKENSFSQIADFYCCNNYINIPSTKFSFSTTGATKYVMARNVWANTANSLEVIP